MSQHDGTGDRFPISWEAVDPLIERALGEDLGDRGDLTAQFTLCGTESGRARILARQPGVVAGLPVAARVFEKVDPTLRVETRVPDGTAVRTGEEVLAVAGALRSVLTAERTALNFLQRLSGVATRTRAFVERVAGTGAVILDTRKTTPGWRALEKYAVKAGGGANHRFGLFDLILIKENHIAAAGSIAAAVERARAGLRADKLDLEIEVEARTFDEVKQALAAGADRIMLDNMSVARVREAVAFVAGRAKLEASGGITLENVRAYAETGVDYISVGALTHSAPALDLSLLLVEST